MNRATRDGTRPALDASAATSGPHGARRRVVVTSADLRQDADRAQAMPVVPAQDRPYRYATPAARRRALRRRKRLTRSLVLALVVVAGIVWVATSGGGGGVAASPHLSVTVTAAPSITPGTTPGAGVGATRTAGTTSTPAASAATVVPWAKSGQSAVDIPSIGYRAQSGVEHAAPVASLTKIMTAYVVLKDHPLELGESGPRITVTPADAANFGTDTVTDQASVELKTGEVLTEYQMLEGLLVHSANDLAYSLARWDAGSVPAFVDKMNATAASLGMTDTHFVDASGFDAGSKSTAADLLTVASLAMQTPVFAQIVDMPSVTLPVAGLVESYTPLVGTTDVVGVKTGYTSEAGGGDVLAYRAAVDGHSFLVLAAVTGQEGPTVLDTAANDALAIARAAAAKVQAATVVTAGEAVARISTGGRSVEVVTAQPAALLYLPGESVHQVVRVRAPRVGAKAGTVVGSVEYRLGPEAVSVPVRTVSRVG